jgi:hypothetical protein
MKVAGALAISASLLGLVGGAVMAAPGGGAQVTRDAEGVWCTYYLDDGTPYILGPSASTRLVVRPDGSETWTCKFKDFGNSTGKAIRLGPEDFDGKWCPIAWVDVGPPLSIILGAPYPDWHATISASGRLSLVCSRPAPPA